MKSTFFASLFVVSFLSPFGTAQAATSSAFAGGSISIDAVAYDLFGNDFVPDLILTGDEFVGASASVTGGSAIEADEGVSTFTISNPHDVDVELMLMFDAYATASTSIKADELQSSILFDSNAFVSLDFVSSFASTNGDYSCTDADPFSPGFNCFGVDQFGSDDAFDSVFLNLAPDETLSFGLRATAFAFLETEVQPVPLPASALLLGLGIIGLGGVGAMRRKGRCL